MPLQLRSLAPAGAQSHAGETWTAIRFALINRSAEDRQARVLTFYPGEEDRQFGRDAWVPAGAWLWTWSSLGPPATRPEKSLVELKSYLYDRTGGREHLVRSPDGPPAHSELARFYRREPGTTLMLDADLADGSQKPITPRGEARAQEVRELVRVFRHRASLSSRVDLVKQRELPPFPEALDGVQHFVLASNRIADDIAGGRALREWLERGGTLWVLLDQVEAEAVTPFLGDVLPFQVVDRVRVHRFHLAGASDFARRAEKEPAEREEPVDFVRVLAPHAQVLFTLDGWPAAFQKEVGRGRVLVTTLGPRGWMRPREPLDPKSGYPEFPQLALPLAPLEALTDELQPRPDRPLLAPEDLNAYVSEQIGYAVVTRQTVLVVFGLLFVGLTAVTVALNRRELLEHLGWLGPVLAVGAAGVFIALGERSRGAIPATVALAEVIDAIPGQDEAQASGILGVYQPALADAPIGVEQGGTFALDFSGLEGRDFRHIQTDLDRWHWENLELPSGARLGPFRHTIPTAEPLEAVIHFGPEGVEGRLSAGPLHGLENALLTAPGQQPLAAHLAADGAFRAGSADELPPGQFLLGALLSDRERAQQKLYAKLLADPQPRYLAQRSFLLAWADPIDLHFRLAREPRTTGAALLMAPLQWERTPPDTPVVVPASFVDCRRVTADGQLLRAPSSGRDAATMRLRFQIPASVLSLKIERARLSLRLTAAARDVAIDGVAGGQTVPLRRVNSPLGVEQIDIEDPRLLQPDEHGALYVEMTLGEARGAEQDTWRLERAALEIRGKTAAGGEARP